MNWLLGNLKIWAGAVALVFVSIAAALIRKSGGDAERAQQAQADLRAANTIAQNRTDALSASYEELEGKRTKWTRKP